MQKRTRKMGRPRGRLSRKIPLKWAANPERLKDATLLNLAIQVSKDPVEGTPMTDTVFAESILHCDTRTIRKYRAGRALPKLARLICEQIVRDVRNVSNLQGA